MPLAPHLRQQLAVVVQAYERGSGPVEQEVLRRKAAGLPNTPVQIGAYAERCYPSDVRALLDRMGAGRLYRDDIGRALAFTTDAVNRTSVTEIATPAEAHRQKASVRGSTGWLRSVLFVLAALAGAGIVVVALPKLEREQRPSSLPKSNIQTPAAAPAPEESMCIQRLRNNAIAWCESALTGSPAHDNLPEAKPGACGDQLRANGETVRSALNGVLDDGATYTYAPGEARERCAAAARLAVTP